jgi:hypothetical protein
MGVPKMDINEVPATKPIAKGPWNKKDKVIAKALAEYMGWETKDIDAFARKWSRGRLGVYDITQEHIKAFNLFIRNQIISIVGEDGLDEYLNEILKREGLA